MHALRAGQLFDGVTARGPSLVLVRDGRVVGVLPADHPAPDGVDVHDLGDTAALLPGLIDTHVHLAFDCTVDVVDNVQRVTDEQLLADMRVRARAALTAGVTTMRDLGDRRYLTLRLRDELAAQPAAGPELLAAGPPITSEKGHCWFLGGEVVVERDRAAALRAAVAQRVERGVDAIKVIVTGGELTPGSHSHVDQFSRADLEVMVGEAHRHGLPVAAHAHGVSGVASAVAAGVDTIEHCSFVGEDGVTTDDALVRAIAASRVIVSATLGFAPGAHPPPPLRIAKLLPLLHAHLERMAAAGVTFTVGTDAGVTSPKPHDVLPYGAVALADIGLGPAAALVAVTATAARACGVAERKGALRPGFDADLLAVRGDPLTDIRALHHVLAVYRGGVRVAGTRITPPAPPLADVLARLADRAADAG